MRIPSRVVLVVLLFTVRFATAGEGDTPPAVAASPGRPQLVVQLGHVGKLQSVALSPDGRWALTGATTNLSGEAILWELDTGREIRRFGDSGNQGPRPTPAAQMAPPVTSGPASVHT